MKRVRVNERIRIPRVRLIDNTGNQVGVISRDEALNLAKSKSLDLVEIAPHERPPVCKIMDYGKYLYQEKQKQKQKKQKAIKVKELKLGVKIQEHDYLTKLKFAREFLENGNRLKVRIFFRGREIVHRDRGKEILGKMVDDLSDISKVELPPKMEGRQMVMQFIPVKGVKNVKIKD
ncbi:MAG: translation initiation factor IF-3 [candidate division WOR-3 bacterium]|nr:translation initiation factor IF-3 [candidate division WOR-3 bacterium]